MNMENFEDFEAQLDDLGVNAQAGDYYELMSELMLSNVEIDDDAESLLMLVQQRVIDNKRAFA